MRPKGNEPHENGGSVPNRPLSPALEQSVTVTAVRTLSVPDISRASAMLAHTFEESPLFRCAFSDPGRRRRASNAIFRAAVKDGLRFGRVFLARNPEIVGALIAYGPGDYPLSVFQRSAKSLNTPESPQLTLEDLSGSCGLRRPLRNSILASRISMSTLWVSLEASKDAGLVVR